MKRILFVLALVLIVGTTIAACAPAPAPAPQIVKETVIVPQTVVVQAPPPTAAPAATAVPQPIAGAGARVAAIKSRGKLICGVNDQLPGFGFLDKAKGTFAGFDIEFCKAVAVALFGDATKMEYRPVTAAQRGPALQTGEVDVLIRNTTWTVTRDATWGLFVATTFYDGQGMMINKTKTPNVKTLKDLKDASICVQTGTTTELNLTDKMREAQTAFKPVVFDTADATFAAYEAGRCDAVTTDNSGLVSRKTLLKTPADHVILDLVMSKEPLGPSVPLGDSTWFNIVKWVVFTSFEAEEYGITSKNVDDKLKSTDPNVKRLLGVEGDLHKTLGLEKDWLVKVLKAVGNYGEIYDNNLGPNTPINLPRGVNRSWINGGILYAPPYR